MVAALARNTGLGILALMLALAGAPPARGAESGKLVAPLYPGAKPVDDNKKCGETSKYHWEVCSQYTTDSIAKVKAFYDGKIGAKRFAPSRTEKGTLIHWAPLAWYYSLGEDGEADVFPGVALRARTAPAWPASGDQARAMLDATEHFRPFQNAFDWSGGAQPALQGMRPIQQMKDLYAKNSYLEARYFPDPAAVNALRAKHQKTLDDRLRVVDEQRKKDEKAAEADMKKTMQDMTAQTQSANQQMVSGPEAQADRAEMDALMKRKPGLWAKAKPSYDKGNALMNEGMKDMNEAKLKQAEVEMKKANDILRTDPEVAAMQDKHLARADARAKAQMNTGAMQRMQNLASGKPQAAMIAKGNKAKSDAIWETWSAYLAELAKLPNYATRVEVGHAQQGEGKEFSNKPEVVVKKLEAVSKKISWSEGDSATAYKDEEKAEAKAASAGSGKAAPAQEKKTAAKPSEEKKSTADEAKETAKKAGAEGLKMLKKLF